MANEDELITVIAIENPVQQAIIEDVLTNADIPYMVKNAGLQDLFGAGQLGGTNLITGPVEIQVPQSEYDRAQELINHALENSEPEEHPVEESTSDARQEEILTDDDEGNDVSIEERAAKYSNYSVIWSVLWAFGIGSFIAICFGVKALVLLEGYPRVLKSKAIFGLSLGIIGLFIWLKIFFALIGRY